MWIIIRLSCGLKEMWRKKYKLALSLLWVIVCLLIWRTQAQTPTNGFEKLEAMALGFMYVVLASCGLFMSILFSGHYLLDVRLLECFRKIGLKNKDDKYPILSDINNLRGKLKITFISEGISVETWKSHMSELENVLDMSISDISTGRKYKYIVITGIKGKRDLVTPILWESRLLPRDGTILLGKGLYDNVSINLHLYPHILIGGATGSGKTWELRLMLGQCVNLGYKVYIADLKGGVDYSHVWHQNCSFAFNEAEVLKVLEAIICEQSSRLKLLAETGYDNIDSYNSDHFVGLPHIVFACDEIAELLDTTGLDKSQKENVKRIEQHIRTIARLGRAPGIHLFLATQRSDADVISGQIKANILYRICGRADNMLSMVTLDNTSAADSVPKDAEGVFINHDGTIFKGFLFKDSDLLV